MKTAAFAVSVLVIFLAVIGISLPGWLIAASFGVQFLYITWLGEQNRRDYRKTQKKIRELRNEKMKSDLIADYEHFRKSRAITTSYIEIDE